MKDLRLSLKRKWFDMTDSGVKTEDYREINEYWVKRLFDHDKNHLLFKAEKSTDIMDFVDLIRGYSKFIPTETVERIGLLYGLSMKVFDTTTVTLGYPKANDPDRIITYKQLGIEIRTGNPEWGAEPNKLCFVIKHGYKLERTNKQ